MCLCNPRNVRDRFCGIRTCKHPLLGDPAVPSTVNAKTGAWYEAHALEIDLPKEMGIHPAIAAAHLGFDLSHLDDLTARLRAAANGARDPIVLHFGLDVLAKTAELGHLPGAAASNGGHRDAAGHYTAIASKAASAHRALEYVVATLGGTSWPSAEVLRRLVFLVDKVARPLCLGVIQGLLTPPADAHGIQPHLSPLRPGEPA